MQPRAAGLEVQIEGPLGTQGAEPLPHRAAVRVLGPQGGRASGAPLTEAGPLQYPPPGWQQVGGLGGS